MSKRYLSEKYIMGRLCIHWVQFHRPLWPWVFWRKEIFPEFNNGVLRYWRFGYLHASFWIAGKP